MPGCDPLDYLRISDWLQFGHAASRIYTDFGTVNDAESGSLLGTFYLTGSTPATGPTGVDTALGKAFVLDTSTSPGFGAYNQIQIFNNSSFNPFTASVIPVSVSAPSLYSGNSISRLTRWGKNGLAFRAPVGVYSLRSNLVQDLSTTSADLGISVAASGSKTGASLTYIATVLNAGPSAASGVSFTAQIPASALLVSASSPAGTCAATPAIACDLGSLPSGASAVVTVVVTPTNSGNAVFTAQVSGSENDPNLTNNQATSTVAVTGSAYNPPPTISSLVPAAILSGSTDTVLTVNGSGFASSSTILFAGKSLPTNVVSSSKLTATVPAASLSTLGWAPVTVSTPVPGGGLSNSAPLSIYSVITLGLNHMLYDPYSRKIMASVGSGSSSVTGNSIVAITPETASVGSPVAIGSQPTNLALPPMGRFSIPF